jgi:hypothetical protein
MSEPAQQTTGLLPYITPDTGGARLFLHGVRLMGVGGLNDAHAACMMIGAFGLSFRRPLVLLRALMAELARGSSRTIMIAPNCCARMTMAESMLLDAVARAQEKPALAHDIFRRLCGIDEASAMLSGAQALAQAFADLGRPIEV